MASTRSSVSCYAQDAAFWFEVPYGVLSEFDSGTHGYQRSMGYQCVNLWWHVCVIVCSGMGIF